MEKNKSEIRNFILAVVVSAIFLYAVDTLFPAKNTTATTAPAAQSNQIKPPSPNEASFAPSLPAQAAAAAQQAQAEKIPQVTQSVEDILNESDRIAVKTPSLEGSIRLKGARFDNLSLIKYRETLAENSPFIRLFSPAGTEYPYFAEFGWTSNDSVELPNAQTVWQTSDAELTPAKPVTLSWQNKKGVKFIRQIAVDDNYMFTITDRVENNSKEAVTLFNYGLVGRTNVPEATRGAVLEGMVGYLDNSLKEYNYAKMDKEKQTSFSTTGGWAGITDKYWMAVLAFEQDAGNVFVKFTENDTAAGKHYQADFLMPPKRIEAGEAVHVSTHMFAGAKELSLIDAYEKDLNIKRFDLTVDFGWYYFLTKPFFYILRFFYGFFGNMGLAILFFAFLLRLAMYPIANKSFVNMEKMKVLGPKITELQQKYGEDKVTLNQKIMDLYKREQVNPASGCLPMLIQIPVFFSLYKVLYISLDLRQAPFYGWIHDLSAPDPSSVFTLFGLVNWPVPDMLNIGIWPVVMGLTMWLQQKMSPAPADKTQARVIAFMPIFMTFLLGNLASGLVIYWAWSNILAIIQQRSIRYRFKESKK